MNAVRIMVRINRIEKMTNTICMTLVDRGVSDFFGFLLAIFHSQVQVFVKGSRHGFFKFFYGYGFQNV